MTCTIVSKHLNTFTKDQMEKLSNKLESSLVLSVIVNPDEYLDTMIHNIVEKNLSDICIINDQEVRIKRVLNFMKERNMEKQRLYFLKLNRIF
jgi:hypothetical protein